MGRTLRVAQLNMHGSKVVHDELRALLSRGDHAVVLAQEPWRKGVAKGMGL